MWHLRHGLRILLFFGKVMFRSQDIQDFVFLTIPLFNKSLSSWWVHVMMSISTWDRVHFWMYHLNHNSLSHQTWPTDRYEQGKYFFRNLFNNLRDLGLVPGPFQFSNLLQLLDNQLSQDFSISLFWKGK